MKCKERYITCDPLCSDWNKCLKELGHIPDEYTEKYYELKEASMWEVNTGRFVLFEGKKLAWRHKTP